MEPGVAIAHPDAWAQVQRRQPGVGSVRPWCAVGRSVRRRQWPMELMLITLPPPEAPGIKCTAAMAARGGAHVEGEGVREVLVEVLSSVLGTVPPRATTMSSSRKARRPDQPAARSPRDGPDHGNGGRYGRQRGLFGDKSLGDKREG